MQTPLHQHDCDQCQYVWTVDGKDWYVCPGAADFINTTIIGRYGDEGSHYHSYPMCILGYKEASISVTKALAQATWIKWQERNVRNSQAWCDFVNTGKLYKEVYREQHSSNKPND